MPWFAAYTTPGKERKLMSALRTIAEESDTPDMFQCYTLPVKNILLHEGREPEKKVGIVFVNTSSVRDLSTLKPFVSHRFGVTFTVMYDSAMQQYLIVPDRQMTVFQRLHPEDIEEVVILSKPFRDYAHTNQKYVILQAPYDGLEGYKIDLHKQKKLAVSIGGMTIAIDNLYKFKIARVFEEGKDKLFAHQQFDRLVFTLIGTLQVFGFPDTAYATLRHLIALCHDCGDDVMQLQHQLATHPDSKEYHYIRSLDGVTAGYLQSVTAHIYKDTSSPDLNALIPDRRILPFLTPHSGALNLSSSADTDSLLIVHTDYDELIKRVKLKERRTIDGKTQLVTTTYYAHIGRDHATNTLFSAFDIYNTHFSQFSSEIQDLELQRLTKAESPLPSILSPENALQPSTPKDYIALRTQAIEHLFQAPRLESWRSLLPKVWIH